MDIEQLKDKLDADTLTALRDYIESLKKPATNDHENKVTKLEQALARKTKEHEEAVSMHRKLLRDMEIQKAVNAHEWVDVDLMSVYVSNHTIFDGDKVLFKSPEGRTVPLDEAVATLAKAKPHLVKNSPHGSGYQKPKDSAEPTKNPWTKEHFNLTEQARIMKADPTLAARLSKEK